MCDGGCDRACSWAGPLAAQACGGECMRRKGGTVSKEQKMVMESLEKSGYRVVVARGWEEAREAVQKYAGVQ